VYTDLQPDKVPPATIARTRTRPIPEQPFPHKTDKTTEGCQVSNYQHDNNMCPSVTFWVQLNILAILRIWYHLKGLCLQITV